MSKYAISFLLTSFATMLLGAAEAKVADVSGNWSGSFYGGPIYLMLKQDGNKLIGTGGTSETQQALTIADGKIESDRVTFKMGPVQFDLRMKGTDGADLQGELKVGEETSGITLTRVEALAKRGAQPVDGPPPAFDVASVKPNKSGMGGPITGRGGSIRVTKGQVAMENVSLWKVIAFAYGLAEDKDYSIAGPDWMKTERFDIIAKMPPDVRWEQVQGMARTLLAERFKLVSHRESKEVTVYALVVGKSGSKLQAAAVGPGGFSLRPGQIKAKNAGLGPFADRLSQFVDHPVVDMTGLKGSFDFTLEWTPDVGAAAPAPGDAPAPQGPTVFTAIQEQLGLRLEARKAPVDVLVVDRAEKVPVEN